ncbi:MAG TPA: butyrate kinase [candidate division Zixibacteria bacterium]|nr:butyrate kinase [candidate division Zixibacteria bacterium]
MIELSKLLDEQIGAMRLRPAAIFAESEDRRSIEAASYLVRFIRPVFLVPEERIREIIANDLSHCDQTRLEFLIQESAFWDIKAAPEILDQLAHSYTDLPDGVRFADYFETARQLMDEPAMFGIMAVREGHADMVIGGLAEHPKGFLEHAAAILGETTVSKSVMFHIPDHSPKKIFPKGLAAFGDIALNTYTNADILARICVQTCMVIRDLIPADVLPEICAGIVLPSHKTPLDAVAYEASKLVEGLIDKHSKENTDYESIVFKGIVRADDIICTCESECSPKCELNALISPNAEMGDVMVNLLSGILCEAEKVEILAGVGSRCVDLDEKCTSEDVVLSVKAALASFPEEWEGTPKDTFFRDYRILVINPGSTSTKIAVFEGDKEVFTDELKHTAEELAPFKEQNITEQYGFRKDVVLKALADHGFSIEDIDAISARGGLIKPIPHGTYAVNEEMINDLMIGVNGQHASNLGGLIASELVKGSAKPAFIVDPVMVDEVPIRAKITGFKEIRRKVISHALNQIATAKRYAEENETFYEYLNLIVAHMGGGITIGAHKRGQYIDVNNGLNGEGPFTPERSGSLPVGQLIDLCFSGKYTHQELKMLNKGKGGLVDLLGTSDFYDVEIRYLNGEPEVVEVFEALVYQISKNITALLPAFGGEKVDQVLLTGGMARSKPLCEGIRKAVAALGCGVSVYPGENEMVALAFGALRVLRGKEDAREYAPEG